MVGAVNPIVLPLIVVVLTLRPISTEDAVPVPNASVVVLSTAVVLNPAVKSFTPVQVLFWVKREVAPFNVVVTLL